jgi:hypothetical protein
VGLCAASRGRVDGPGSWVWYRGDVLSCQSMASESSAVDEGT